MSRSAIATRDVWRMTFEPDVLRLGKAFGNVVALEYPAGMAEGIAHAEAGFSRSACWLTQGLRLAPPSEPSLRLVRADVVLELRDDETDLPVLVVLEVKRTLWDRQSPARVRPNVLRHAAQVWRYLDALLPHVDAGRVAWLQAALVYPRRPSDPGRRECIETILDERGISVLWYDDLAGG